MNTIKTKLRNWLIADEKEKLETKLKEFEKSKDTLMRDLDYWHRTFRSFSVEPCAYCKKQMRIYPYGGAYYYIKNNRKVHAECYDKYLGENI